MTLKVQSPYLDDEIRVKGIEKTIEDWIYDNWDIADIPVTDIAFDKKGTQILQSGKSITLKCYVFHNIFSRFDISGQKWTHRDSINIDVYVLNNNKNDSRDPRAIKILIFLKDLIMINQRTVFKGIFQLDPISANIQDDPFKNNLTNVSVKTNVTYNWNIVDL